MSTSEKKSDNSPEDKPSSTQSLMILWFKRVIGLELMAPLILAAVVIAVVIPAKDALAKDAHAAGAAAAAPLVEAHVLLRGDLERERARLDQIQASNEAIHRAQNEQIIVLTREMLESKRSVQNTDLNVRLLLESRGIMAYGVAPPLPTKDAGR